MYQSDFVRCIGKLQAIMRKTHLIILFFTFNFGFSQTKTEMNLLLNEIAETKDSKEITKTEQGRKLIEYGWKLLPILAEFFTDQTETNVKSECIERNLTKGEIAIIIADQIEMMPYATVTGVQNCLLTFCEKNINLIEYYFPYIKRDGIEKFQRKYNQWLVSSERNEWEPFLNNKFKEKKK
jgi:hypothetical protein